MSLRLPVSRRLSQSLFCVLFCALAPAGCGERDALGVRRVAPESARGDAVISGTVRLAGTPPVMKPLKSEPCHDGAQTTTIVDETVIVGEGGGLKNVFVYVENGPKVDGRSLAPAVLDQVNCVYVPHVVGVVVGQPLKVKSSDDVFHNTHYTPAKNPHDNFSLLRAGHERDVRFVAAEIFPVRCDVHPWMSAHVGVFDNEFFAATLGNGAFEIRNLPPGEYTVVARHELYGPLRKTIKVAAGASHALDFEYAPPQ